MLNHIWAFLIVIGVLAGVSNALYKMEKGEVITTVVEGKTITEVRKYQGWEEKLKAVTVAGSKMTGAAFNAVSVNYTDEDGKKKTGAIGMAFDLIGIMALWLGMMKIADRSGIVLIIARVLRPFLRFLFPTVPPEHPAAGAMLMTFAANIMGLDNATTPLAIKAMKELQTLNSDKSTASNAICTFVSINLASMVILPTTIIGYRIANGCSAETSTSFIVPFYVASIGGLITAFTMCRILEKFTADPPGIPLDEALAASEKLEEK